LAYDAGKAKMELVNFPIGDRRVEFTVPSRPEMGDDGNPYYEPEVLNIIGKVVRPDDLVVDAGANYGYFTLIMARLVGPKGLVVSFEPDPVAFSELEQNVEANNLDNVMYSDIALWDSDGEKDFWVYPKSGYSSFSKYVGAQKRTVKTRTLDTILQFFRQPRFMKLDCEGAEPWILHGAEEILRKGVDYIIAELNYEISDSFNMSKTLMREYMASLGYHMYLISIRDGENYKIVRVPPEQELVIRCDDETRARQVNVMFSRLSDPLATERI
jgi:FkbM family methyltransferase